MTTPVAPDVASLRLLDAVQRAGSITLAATELGVTQQAASRRLRRLEDHLGRRLVERSARASRLTEDGTALLTCARPLLEASEQFQADAAALFAESDELTVAASQTVAEHFLPRWVAGYREAGGDVRRVRWISTNTAQVVRMVSEGAADLGFVEGAHPPAGLSYRRITDDLLSVYVAPEHPWARTGRVGALTLARTPLVTREQGSGCRDALLAALEGHGVDAEACVESALELTSNTAVIEAAAANVAPAVVSTRVGGSAARAGRLVAVTVRGLRIRRELGVVWRSGHRPASPAARELLAVARGGRAD